MRGGVLDCVADFTDADFVTRGIGWVIVNMNRFRESFFIIQAIPGLALFLIATPALAQIMANRSSQSSSQVQTSAEINQRLQLAREKLAGATTESQTNESRIGPDDLLNISVFEAPEMNCSVRVSASGALHQCEGMPVILAPDDWPRWLGTPDDRKTLLHSFPAEQMECWPVGKAVGNVRNQGPELIERVSI